ncbi:PREDICTED: G protein-activated inward rectifier potassium channel 3-like [Priapulus caudatus]|uniref:G protein-activated inward rectifier potassium channel 3-like n=1 Tax=Priapulus caudatus TaxID=37621 RepID=A0ABM1EZM6_PRICU|nr:PREDICTED: G protein-activated inward rectifier potassium channel 3-like [Priapulus caudatus]
MTRAYSLDAVPVPARPGGGGAGRLLGDFTGGHHHHHHQMAGSRLAEGRSASVTAATKRRIVDNNGFLSVPEVTITSDEDINEAPLPLPPPAPPPAAEPFPPSSSPSPRRLPRGMSRYGGGKRERVQRRRIVQKNGGLNISLANVDNRKRQYIADVFTTLVDLKWRWTIAVFATGFLVSWTSFAVVWFLISYAHGDLDAANAGDAAWTPCVREQTSFASSFLFSLETQHTIGYGSRHITEECPEAILTLVVQSIVGVLIQCFVVGMVFSKISRPKKRAQTLMFSKTAVVCMRDGQLCMLFRVGDMRRSQIIEAHVRALVIKKKMTLEGETLPLHRYDLNVGFDAGTDRIFMIWPVTICHRIDATSPFYDMDADDFVAQKFEMVVILEGVIETTGMTTQARSSYLNGEILWGRRFQRLVTFQREDGLYRIDYSRFHNAIAVDTPRFSARQLDEIRDAAEEAAAAF